MSTKSTKAYFMFISAMLIYGTIGIFRRYIPLSSALLACIRGFLGAVALAVFVKIQGKKIKHNIGVKKILLLAVTGGIMGANWIFLFEAYNHTTVAIATLCYYMQPTVVILLSPLVFREKMTITKSICVLLSLLGMVFVSGVMGKKAINSTDYLGVALGLIAAVLYACVVILNKKVIIEDTYEKTIIQLLSAAIVLVPYLLFTEDFRSIKVTGFSVAMVLVVGLIHTALAYALYFASLPKLRAQSVAVLGYIDPVSALLLSAIFLGEKMSVYGIIGAFLIIGAALLSEKDIINKKE